MFCLFKKDDAHAGQATKKDFSLSFVPGNLMSRGYFQRMLLTSFNLTFADN